MGIGFAIPINLAKSVLESLAKNGKVVRGWLGVAIQNITEDLGASFNYSGTEGALIGDVTPDGPAEKAGLRSEDIIVKFNGKKIKDVNQLRLAVAATAPKSRVPVEVFRDGKIKTFKVRIEELQDGSTGTWQQSRSSVSDLGLNVETLTPHLRRQLGFRTEGSVVVMSVTPYGVAANSGIQPWDVILKVAGKDVKSSQEFLAEIKKHNLSDGIRLVVETAGMKRFVLLKTY
jgi:serine protease Do